MTHSKDKLAAALRALDLEVMAKRADQGHYDEFLSSVAMPEVQLVNDLKHMSSRRPHQRDEILALRKRVMLGEFDAKKDEALSQKTFSSKSR